MKSLSEFAPVETAVLELIADRQRKLLDATTGDVIRRIGEWAAGKGHVARRLRDRGLIEIHGPDGDNSPSRYTLTPLGWQIVGNPPLHVEAAE